MIMPKNSHSSHGNNDFSVELDISDYTEEITDAIKQAIRRALTKIGLKAGRYAKFSSIEKYIHIDTAQCTMP